MVCAYCVGVSASARAHIERLLLLFLLLPLLLQSTPVVVERIAVDVDGGTSGERMPTLDARTQS